MKALLHLQLKHTMLGTGTADGTLQTFLEWCAKRGIQQGHLAVRNQDGRGRSLQARARFQPEELILEVPAHAILAEGRASSYQASHWTLGIAHRLLEEDCLGEDSAFAPYVQLLLEGEPHEDSEASLPGIAGLMARQRRTRKTAQLEELRRAAPKHVPHRVERALHAVDTRTVYSRPAQACALVPFFDFANHSAYPNARWTMESDRVLRLFASSHIDIDDEVTIFYDSHPNARLLLTYGFVLPGDGPHRCVDLEVTSVSQEDSGSGVQLQVLADGSLRRRAALVPLLRGLTDEELAEHLVKQASAELLQWQQLQLVDPQLVLLCNMTIEVLGSFVRRLESWLQDPEGKLLTALGPQEVLDTHSSDASQDDQADAMAS
ncbi:unnamed protein product [Effrenium voratum]|uniref:SET domain-containing protein n=1 Tax=Effrenium voratum TaxID=2562239 RepID=A0AA36MTR2_9DINO|nr:unnamed protein product [Effrenium voratum]CAJ1434588.1 unnamed protein product [Effrenium voratum]